MFCISGDTWRHAADTRSAEHAEIELHDDPQRVPVVDYGPGITPEQREVGLLHQQQE